MSYMSERAAEDMQRHEENQMFWPAELEDQAEEQMHKDRAEERRNKRGY